MTEETIVAVYDTADHAASAVRDLTAANVPASAISQHANNSTTGSSTTSTAEPARAPGFWGSLFGGEPDHDVSVYDRSIESGATVVTVKVPAQHYDRVSAILEKHNPVDMDQRAAQYGATNSVTETTTTRPTAAPSMAARGTATAASDGGTIQLAEETLSVGKRAVSRGTTRIRRYVVETPAEEQVTLHNEKVTMERRPVTNGETIKNADFSDRSIEMTETSEEAVVSKTARVKEEISLRKEVTDRVETVKDTLRHDEVKIEQVPGEQVTTRTATMAPVPPAAQPPRTPKI